MKTLHIIIIIVASLIILSIAIVVPCLLFLPKKNELYENFDPKKILSDE